MSAIARALLDELDEHTVEKLAALIAPHLHVTNAREPWLDTAGAAHHLAVSPQRIRDLCSQRATSGIPVHKLGGRNRFRASELDSWLLNQQETPHA